MAEAALSHSLESWSIDSKAFSPSFYSAATLPEPVTSVFTYATGPAWLDEIKNEIDALKLLPPDWDTYGAPKPSPILLGAALPLLAQVVCRLTPRPSVVPTSDGSVQFEWYTRGFEITIRMISATKFHLSVTDLRGVFDEVDSALDFDLRPLARAVDALSLRQ